MPGAPDVLRSQEPSCTWLTGRPSQHPFEHIPVSQNHQPAFTCSPPHCIICTHILALALSPRPQKKGIVSGNGPKAD
eukprot:1180158-Prorocentrum_minimum.AAC.2